MRAKHAALLAALAALALPAQPAAARSHTPLPQFEVSNASFSRYAFKGESGRQFSFCERTTNIGPGATSRRLHNSMILQGYGPGSPTETVAKRDVPKLAGTSHFTDRHGHRHTRHHSHYGCGRGEGASVSLPLGAYDVFLCADSKIKQGSHGKACYVCTKCFFVIKRSWTGTVSGQNVAHDADGDSRDTWQVGSVTYTFAGATGGTAGQYAGQFTYKPTGGSVNHQIAATNGDCSGAGGATFGVSNGELKTDYKAEHYSIFGDVPSGSTVSVTVTCPDKTATLVTPVVIRFLSNGLEQGFTNPLPFGQETLSGVYQTSYGGITEYTSQWSLR